MKVGTKFKDSETGQVIVLTMIVDRLGRVKLEKPIYHFEYENIVKSGFTTYLREVERMVSFKRWIEIK